MLTIVNYIQGSNQFDGYDFKAFAEKKDMLLGTSMSKSITKIIPRMEGTGSVDFYVG
jgi:hypothetical protein